MRKISLFCLALCAMAFYSLPVKAVEVVTIDSIRYQLNDKDKTATVGSGDEISNLFYVGHATSLAIPSQVTYNGKTYTVTRLSSFLHRLKGAVKELTLPGTITTIDEFALGSLIYENGGLSKLNIPANIESYREVVFCLRSADYAYKGWIEHLIIESPKVLEYYSKEWYQGHRRAVSDTATWYQIQIEKLTLLDNGGDTIPSYACKDWLFLREVNFAKYNTQYIGANAFEGCRWLAKTNLEELKVLKRVDNYAFLNCTTLSNGNLPESVTNIGTGVFKGCKMLNQASLPSDFAWVPQEMYEGCATSSWLTITLSDNVTRIMPSAFKNCKLAKLTMPSKIEIIEESAFRDTQVPADNRSYLVLPKSLAVLGDYAFNGSAFTALTVNSEFSAVGKSVFSLSKIETVTINNGSIISRPEVSSARGLFGAAIKKYTINDGEAIRDNFFKGCTDLEEIDFTKAHVLSIGEGAFENCISLKSIDTDDATTLGASAFKGCTSLTDVDLIAVTAIPEYAFQNCSALKNIYLGKAQTLASNAFEGCSAIAAFSAYDATYFNTEGGILYNSNKTHLFLFPRASENFALDDYELPETVTSLHCDAFDYCTHLHSITSRATTPPSVVAKGSRSTLFQIGIERLIKIYVPEASIQAYKNAWGTSHCEYYALQSGTCTVDGITYEFQANLTASVVNGATPYSGNIVVPATFTYGGKTYQVTAVGDDAFDNCTELTSIVLPEGLLRVGNAFGGCVGLTTLTLPSTLTSLGYTAFLGCTGLAEIICKAANPPTCEDKYGMWPFDDVPTTTPLWVPKASVDLYKEATRWKRFKNNTYPFAATCADVNTIDGNSKAFLKPVSVAFVSGRYVYIQDETGTTMLYLNAVDEAIYAGAKITGIEGTTTIYYGLPEVKPANAVADWTITADGDELYTTTITTVPTYYEINQLVKIENLALEAEFSPSKPKEVTITLSNGDIILRNQFSLTQSFVADKRYDIIAGVAINNDVMKLYFIEAVGEHDAPQGIDDVQSDKVQSTKIFRDGQIFILRGDKTYTLTGQELK